MKAIGISDAMASPKLFAPFFDGPSWARWRAIIAAAFCEPMNEQAVALFREVAERDPPAHRVRELVAIVGRGGGKDAVASVIATVIAVNFDPVGKLRPGERATVMALAVDRDQAAIVFNYIRAYFEQIPALAAMVTHMDNEAIELNNGVEIVVSTNTFRGVRGRSIICAIFDEVAFFRDERSASPDVELHAAVDPGLARVPGSMLIMISSAHKRAGLLYEHWRKYYGVDNDDVLVVRGSTLQFNPTFDADVIATALERDPAVYNAEYCSQWRDDLQGFLTREQLDAAVDRGLLVRPPVSGTRYHASADPSGGRSDSFTCGIAHMEGNSVLLDMLFERRPPFNPSEVVAEIAALLKGYGLTKITGDKYAAQWTVEAFAKEAVRYEASERDRSAIYMDSLPLFTSGRARLIDNPKMVNQFAALERRTFSTGRERIDHGVSGHDDLANAAALALVLAASKRSFVISDALLARSRIATARTPYGPARTFAYNRH